MGAGLQNRIECHSPFLLPLTGEDKVVLFTRSRMSYVHSVFGEVPLLSSCAVDGE